MKMKNYKYDVAFAFSKNDEHLANQINDLLPNHFTTFLYPKKLEVIDRPNRELKIMDAFEKQSKMIVVLFRKKWGTTPWTKIEELAVRKRTTKDGYDFILFIPLDHPPIIPKYIPKNQIWDGLGNTGIKGAAEIIEERFKQIVERSKEKLQGMETSDSKIDLDFDSDKLIVQDAVNTLDITMLELIDLFQELKSYKTKIENEKDEIKLVFQQRQKSCTVQYGKYAIKFHLHSSTNKKQKESKLYFELHKKDNESTEPIIIAVNAYHFEVKKPGEYGWIKNIGSDTFISSKKLAQKSINILLNQSDFENNKTSNTL